MEASRSAPRVVALMGSYRLGGTIDTAVQEVLDGARERGASVTKIDLVDRRIEFCRNCRECMQLPGAERGRCVIDDNVAGILDEIDAADALVLGAPVNLGDVNALTRQFLERTAPYAFWPAGQPAPKLRRAERDKRAVLVTSGAAPSLLGRLLFAPLKTLRVLARNLGARPIGSLFIGQAGEHPASLDERTRKSARRLGERLVEGA